LITTTVDSL
jgi:hypothetical protein